MSAPNGFIALINSTLRNQKKLHKRTVKGSGCYTDHPVYLCIEKNEPVNLELTCDAPCGTILIKLVYTGAKIEPIEHVDIWDTNTTSTHNLKFVRLPAANNLSCWTLELYDKITSTKICSLKIGALGKKSLLKSVYEAHPDRILLWEYPMQPFHYDNAQETGTQSPLVASEIFDNNTQNNSQTFPQSEDHPQAVPHQFMDQDLGIFDNERSLESVTQNTTSMLATQVDAGTYQEQDGNLGSPVFVSPEPYLTQSTTVEVNAYDFYDDLPITSSQTCTSTGTFPPMDIDDELYDLIFNYL